MRRVAILLALFALACGNDPLLPVGEVPNLAISGGLLAGEQFCEKSEGAACSWAPSNQAQTRVLDQMERMRPLIRDGFPGLSAFANSDVAKVNAFLEAQEVNITLPSLGEDAIAMAGVLSLRGAWMEGGERTTLRTKDDTEYPAARLDGWFSTYQWRQYVAAIVETQEGNSVHLIPMPRKEVEGFLREFQPFLVDWDWESRGDLKFTGGQFNKLIYPLVDHEVVADLDELEGLGLGEFTIGVAKMAKSIKMNELGFISKTGFAAGGLRGLPPPPQEFVINTEFLFLVMREGVPFPLEAEWIPRTSWKDPGDLSF